MSWFDWVPTLLNVGGALESRSIANAGANQASQIEADAATRGAQAQVDAANAAKGYYASSITNDQNMQQQAAPGVANQQMAIAQQNTITPAQQLALDQERQQEQQSLAAGGLAGSGRASVAGQNFLNQNATAGFMQQNRQRADTAGSALSQQYFTAGQNINQQNANSATAGINAGRAVGAGITAAGEAQAGGVTQTANNDVATTGQAINDIGAQIAAENKKYQTSYKSPVSTTGQQI